MPSSHVLVVGISGYDKLRVFTHHQPIVDVVKNSVRQNLSIQDVDPENTAGIALVGNGEGCGQEQMDKFLNVFCLDEISFRQDYNSCRIGVVVVVTATSAPEAAGEEEEQEEEDRKRDVERCVTQLVEDVAKGLR